MCPHFNDVCHIQRRKINTIIVSKSESYKNDVYIFNIDTTRNGTQAEYKIGPLNHKHHQTGR